jgi:hypothetical protein
VPCFIILHLKKVKMIGIEIIENNTSGNTWSDIEKYACRDVEKGTLCFIDIKIDECEELIHFQSLPFMVVELVNNCLEKREDGREIKIKVCLGKEIADDREFYMLRVKDDFAYPKSKLQPLLTKLNRKHTITPLSDISGKKGPRVSFKSGYGIMLVRNMCEELGGMLVYEATEDLKKESTIKAAVRAIASFEVEKTKAKIESR